jgi:ABC-type glycerol-3-phosphate transport system permease component
VLAHRYLGLFLNTLFRGIIFFPVIVSGIAVGLIWKWLMDTSLGLINYYLGALNLPVVAWLDSSGTALWSLILVDVWRNVGFSFVVFTAGLQGISPQLYEAAAVDGAGMLRVLLVIILPLSKPALAALAIFTFNFFWNDFFTALIFLDTPSNLTLPVGLAYLSGQYGQTSQAVILAGVCLAVLPVLAIFLAGQRYIVEGITLTGLKG